MAEDEYINIEKMTYIPKIQQNRGHGWFYRRPGIGRLMEEDRRRTWTSYSPSWPRFYGYHQFDKAHLVMLLEEQIIPRDEGIPCLQALRTMENEGIDHARQQIGGVAHSGEAYLTMKFGWWTGGWIHAGRSSHDLNTVNQRITQRNYLLDLMDNVNDLRETLITLSDQHMNTILPYWSHGQRGRPITLAFYFLTWVKMLERDFERLVLCYKHTNISPAGTSEGTGTDFPLNPHRTAELLGFDAVYENANDMWLTDDFRIEAFATLITIGTPLRRLGEDLQLWSGWEYRIADLADRWCGTSSIMAHKKNPHAIYTLPLGESSAKARIHLGTAEELAVAVRDIINSLQIATEILQTTSWNTDQMMEFCHSGWLCIPDLARTLCVSKGLPWRMAHQICATLVRLATEEGKSEQDVTAGLLDRAAIAYPAFGRPLNVSEQLIRDALNPVNSIHSRIIHGSTSPPQVQKQITSSRQTLVHDKQITNLTRKKLQDAATLLETRITRFLSS
ncbi:MAG: lyase family protein [Candidatus Bathyarchaeota archaeon]|jgi:argininosuccinate lyase|nr:lyase family protein [Candidatus Bathyarchaeota archaeon]